MMIGIVNRILKNYFCGMVVVLLSMISETVSAQVCEEVFPDAASNSTPPGDINFGWGSSVVNSPDNILDTRDLNDGAGPGISCNGVSCTQSGGLATSVNYNTFPGGASFNVPWFTTQSLLPGNYDDLTINAFSTLLLTPGVYTFDGDVTVGFRSQIQLSSEGSAVIYVRDQVSFGTDSEINTTGANRYIFLYARNLIYLDSNAFFNGIIYADQDVTFNNGSSVNGAVTAERNINLNSATSITFDPNKVSGTDFYGFCTSAVVTIPDPIAEWHLDENTWSGAADEIIDTSGTDLHGYSVALGGNHPLRENTDPAIASDPGTCAYGNFNGVNDGHLRINDPGGNSILDLNSEFAVAVWIYPRSWATSDLMSIVSKDINFEFHLNGDGEVNWWWGGNPRELTTAASVPINQWHHIVISYESGNQVIYIDGNVAATHNSTQAITVNNDPVLIGTDLDFNNRNFNGYIDEVKIYDQSVSAAEAAAIMAESHPCPVGPLIDHFIIDIGGGSASTCAPRAVTITAVDASNNTLAAYTGTLNISTSTGNGDWSFTGTASDALGTLTPGASDSGSATYDFEVTGADEGNVTLNLSNAHAETLTITVSESTNAVVSTSAALTFSENAFVITSIDSLGEDVVAGRPHTFEIAMWQRDEASGVACNVATDYNVSDVKTWISRLVPLDAGGAGPQVSNASATDTQILGNSEPAGANFTLPFVNGVANFSLLASDVGAYALNFRDSSGSFSDQNIDGSSAGLVARPFGFYIEVPDNPGASSAGGNTFISAGSDFSVNVHAVGWQLGEDSDNDGIPDGHNDNDPQTLTDLSDNVVLASFGNEPDPAEIELSSTLIAPAGGTAPGLNVVSNSGFTYEVNFEEVGIIEIAANLVGGGYLGSAQVFGKSSYVGRFIPASFAVSNGNITEACTSGLNYSYMNEAFDLEWRLEARNALGNLTNNYEGAFVKLDESNGVLTFGAIDEAAATPLTTRLLHNSTSFAWTAGTGELNSSLTLLRDTAPDGPYSQLNIGATAADTDGVGVPASSFNLDVNNDSNDDLVELGQTEVRFGRLRLEDAFGPETADLPVNFLTEYWSGVTWVTNVDDSCTAIALPSISYPQGTIDIVANRSVSVGGSSSTGTYASLAGAAVNFSEGDAGHYFTAPGAGSMGEIQVNIDLALYPWLRFDWNQDGDFSDSSLPTAHYTFGSYRGHDRVIYWQEILK